MHTPATRTGIDMMKPRPRPQKRYVVILTNSPIYFLDYVFIAFEENGYRLVASQRDVLVHNRSYKTLKGAKIAFVKTFQYLAYFPELHPDWSHPYQPDKMWLDSRLESRYPTKH